MEFEFAENPEVAEEKQKQWWLSLTPEERWRSNWEHVKFLSGCIPGFLDARTDDYILE